MAQPVMDSLPVRGAIRNSHAIVILARYHRGNRSLR
jgi:hypothetical protein